MDAPRQGRAPVCACCICGQPDSQPVAVAIGDPIHEHTHAEPDTLTLAVTYCASTDTDCDGYRDALAGAYRKPYADSIPYAPA